MRLSVVSIPVLDQHRALAFYRDILGFTVHTDQPMDEAGNRWLAMLAPEGTQEVQLLLEPVDEATASLMRTRRAAGMPQTVFISDDLAGEHARLVSAGVTFTIAPTTMPYGGTDAVFEDSEGNLICLHQS